MANKYKCFLFVENILIKKHYGYDKITMVIDSLYCSVQ